MTAITRFFKDTAWTKIFFYIFPIIYIFHGAVIAFYAVDVPFMDEWEALNPNALPAGFTWSWLFVQHNEHRIIFTKLQTWLLYFLNGWNVATQEIMNYLIFGCILLVLIRIYRRNSGHLKIHEYLAFLIFLLSPLLHQNHMWGFQSQFHLVLLFFLITSLYWFSEDQSFKNLSSGSFFGLMSIFSFSNGLVACGALFGVFTFFKWTLALKSKKSRKKHLSGWAFVAFIMGTGALCWLHNYIKQPDPSFKWAYPNSWLFWRYFLNLVSLGFGANGENAPVGFVAFAFVLSPFILSIKSGHFKRWNNKEWTLLGLLGGILAALSAIALGRGSNLIGSKSSRYAEVAILLIPISFLSWELHYRVQKKSFARFFAIFWLILAFSFLDDWKFIRPYKGHAASEIVGLKCVENYYKGLNQEANCPELYPGPIAARLDRARELNISFTRKITDQSHNQSH